MPKKNSAAQALGRLGGQAGTDAQNRARRANAQFAGRPGRVCLYCGEPVIGGHVDRAQDEACGAHGWRWQKRSEDDRPAIKPDPALLRDVFAFLTADARVRTEDLRKHARLVARLKAALRAAGASGAA